MLCLRKRWRTDNRNRAGCSTFVTKDQTTAGTQAADCTLYDVKYDTAAHPRAPAGTGSPSAGVTLTHAAAADTYQLILFSQAVRNTKKTSAGSAADNIAGVSDLIYDSPLACTHQTVDVENTGIVATCRAHGRSDDVGMSNRNSRTDCLAELKADGSNLCQFNAWHFDGSGTLSTRLLSNFETATWNKQESSRLVALGAGAPAG